MLALCVFIPSKQHFYSILRVRTMPIYLFHGLVYSILKDSRILEKVDFPVETGLLLGFCVLLTFALATELPYKFTTWISSFPVRLPKSFSRSKKTAV